MRLRLHNLLFAVAYASRGKLGSSLRASSAIKLNLTSLGVTDTAPSDSATMDHRGDIDRSRPAKIRQVSEGSATLSQIIRVLNFKQDLKLKKNKALLAHLQGEDGNDQEGVFLPFPSNITTRNEVPKPASELPFSSDFDGFKGNGAFDPKTVSGQLAQKHGFWLQQLFSALGGTGGRAGQTGNSNLDRTLLRRMASQDMMVLIMLAIIYIVTLIVGWSIVYRMSQNSLPVKFYSDHQHMLTLGEEAADTVDGFLQAFNSTPKGICLQVTGFKQSEEGEYWRGHHYVPEFCFSLDLSPWTKLAESVPGSERQKIHTFLRNSNVLHHAEICMDVDWKNWEDLAINIKQQIRATGFQGPIDVNFARKDTVKIFQNAPWANFMHSQTTKALCALSVVGIFFYVPYMWLRCTKSEIKSTFKVDVDIKQYWTLISDKLTAQEFLGGEPMYRAS